jgi:hypothetical protein
MRSAPWPSLQEVPDMSIRTVRAVAVAAAAASAVLYVLIGFEVLDVGNSTTGTNDILGFGLMMGAVYALIAVVLALVSRTWVLATVWVLDLIVIAGYFTFAGLREPPFEAWGLLVKAVQLVLLVAVGYMVVHRAAESPDRSAAAA